MGQRNTVRSNSLPVLIQVNTLQDALKKTGNLSITTVQPCWNPARSVRQNHIQALLDQMEVYLMSKALMSRFVIIFLSSLLAFQTAWAGNEKFDQLLSVSGFDQQIQHIPAIMKMAFSQDQQLPTNVKKAFIDAVDGTFQPATFKNNVTSRLQNRLSDQDLNTLMAWYNTPTAHKITAEENAASTPEALVDMQLQAPNLMNEKNRMAFARRLDELTGTTDSAMSIQEYTGIAILSAMASSSSNAASGDMDTIKAMLSSQLAQQRQIIADQIAVQMVYTYRNIDDATLASYEKTLQQPAFTRFYRTAQEGINRGFEDFISDWTNQLAQSGAL